MCIYKESIPPNGVLKYTEKHTQTHCIFLPNTNLITTILAW